MAKTTPHPEFHFYQVAKISYDGYLLPINIDGIIHTLQTGAVVLLTEAEAEPWLAGRAVLPLPHHRAE